MTRLRKLSVTFDEFNAYLRGQGLKPLPDEYRDKTFSAANGDPDVFGSTPPAVTTPEPKKKEKPAQPLWKWSWDPAGGLLLWAVDREYGQPHHIEVTGPNFYNLAQGRVYADQKGGYEILVWEDRASDDWQEEAVEAVNEWLLLNTGQEANDVFWQSEGGYYQTIGDGKPDMDKMIETYFGIGMAGLPSWRKEKLRKQYKDLFGETNDLAPDPVAQHQENDDKWLKGLSDSQQLDQQWQDAVQSDTQRPTDACPTCGGEGVDLSGHLCLTCKGTGVDPRVSIQA